jgi:hypothetical protein
MTLEEYIDYIVFDLLYDFYNKAQKIEAKVNLYTHNLQITKNTKTIRLTFNKLNQKILDIDTLGFLDIYGYNINYIYINYKIYLTSKFEWVIKIDNEKLIKINSGLINYIIYKAFGILA